MKQHNKPVNISERLDVQNKLEGLFMTTISKKIPKMDKERVLQYRIHIKLQV